MTDQIRQQAIEHVRVNRRDRRGDEHAAHYTNSCYSGH